MRTPIRTPVTVRDILTPLFFFKQRVAIAFLIPLILSIIAAALAPKVYEADTRLLILLGDDYVFRSSLGGALPGLSFDRSQIVKAETEIIGSRELSAQTVQAVGVTRLYPKAKGPGAYDAAVERFQKSLTIENIPQSNVIRISLKLGDPVVAADALNQLVGFYLDRRRQVFEQNNTVSVDQQTSAIQQQLATLEAELAAFSKEHGIGDLQLELTAANNQQIGVRAQLLDLQRQVADREGRSASLAAERAANPVRTELTTDYTRSLQLDGLEQSLVGLENQRRDAAQEYVDGSPVVKDFDERIAKIRAQIATVQKQQVNASRIGTNPVRQDIDTRYSASQGELGGLRKSVAQAQAQLDAANARLDELVQLAPQYRQLVRQRDLLEAAGTELAKRGQEGRLASSLSRSQANVRVLQAARPPLTAHTGRPVLLLSGLVIGLIAAAGIVVVSVALFQGMLTPNDVAQKLATPVILALNNAPGAGPRPPERGMPSPIYMTGDDSKVLGHLLRSISSGASCSVQIIGPEDGVGVTTMIVDFALLAARDRQKVLVLDMEPLPGRSAMAMLRDRGAVLEQVGEKGSIVRVAGSNLFVTQPKASNEPAMSERDWKKLLGQTCGEFDLVLIDAPPLARSWLGLFAAPSVDLTLAVIEAEHTRAPVALNMIERIGGVGGEVAAALFNKRRFYIPRIVYNWL